MKTYNCVVFIGSNPSIKAHNTIPFHNSTRSRHVLDDWIDVLDINNTQFLNVTNTASVDNRPLTSTEIKNSINALRSQINSFREAGYKIVALGNTAAKALDIINIRYFKAPHPSGRNRLLNNKNYVKDMLQQLKEFIHENNET